MVITLFIGALYGGGAERVVCNLANYLVDRGHIVKILTMSESKQHYELSDAVTHSYLISDSERKNFLFDSFRRLSRLRRYLRHNQDDAYVVFLPITILLLLLLRRRVKSKIIASERNSPNKYNLLLRLMLRITATKADAWVCQTEEIKVWYENIIKNVPISVIPNAINPEFLLDSDMIHPQKTIVSVGRLSKQKRFDLLIEAFAIVNKKYPEYRLEIYGDGPCRDAIANMIFEYHLQDSVSLCGNRSPILNFIKDASIFVMTSDYEGMPNALIEAMAIGIPSVATNCDGGGAQYLIENKINGILVTKGDHLAVADSIIWLIENPNMRRQIGENAKNIVHALSPEVIYNRWECFIKSIIEN